MQARQAKIQAEIDQIITCLHKNASEELRNNYLSFWRKIFSTGAGRPNTDTAADLKEKIAIKVTNTHDQRSVLQCQDITQRFLASNTIHRKQEVLRMLLKLSDLNNRNQEDMSNVFRQARKKDLNYTVETNISNITQSIPQPRRSGQLAEQLRMIRSKDSVEGGISESEMVRQLSFAFTNTSSSEIMETTDGYQLKSSLNVSETVRRMVSQLADLGWLHKRITKAMEKEGAVRKALKLAVQEELNQYYRWIGTMENLARQNRLNLRKLQVWAFYPTELLKWLAIVVEEVEPFEGSHILSILNAYRPSGIEAVDGLLNRLLSHSLQPLLNYIHRWTYRGQLVDPSNQFFIWENKKVYQSEEWQERFKLVAQNVPSILDSQSARMIFSTGKAIHFLLNRCKVLYQVKTPFLETNTLADNANSLLTGPFRTWLETVHGEVSRALVETLFGQFHLRHHLLSIKNFFLAGKGDFIQHLYDNLKDLLSVKKQEVSQHSLDGYINDAVLKCFPDFKLPDGGSYINNVAFRLLAKKMQFGSGNEAWDCFNFQYSLERIEPLQVILSPEVMLSYQKIFSFLWRVKQVQENLKGLWASRLKEQALQLRRTRSRHLDQVFHMSYLLRSAMLHFLNSLHSYLMVTLEAAWDRFTAEAFTARTLDELLIRHRSFQQQALEITLCTPREKNLQISLGNIFSVIGNFKVVYLRLKESFNDYYEKLRLYEDRQLMARRGITVESLEVPEINLGKSAKDLRQVKSVFETTFRSLFIQLRKEGEGRVTSLTVLAAKLDFSQYYSNLYLE